MVINGHTEVEIAAIVATPIPVALIDPSRLNRHSDDSDTDIAELAQTIQENGLLAPISARPRDGGRYEIICGERRWRAFRLLERETIPCIVKDLDDTQAQIERIVENYQRRDPSFLEQGEAVAALMKLTNRDIAEVASRLGQSPSWVRRRAKLPNLISAWRTELEKADTPYIAIRDSATKLEEIAILPASTQQSILDKGVLRNARTVAEMRQTIACCFMDLDAKPWSRAWEKKAFSGSGKKRCDACMKRTDRENALFPDPNDPNTGKKMCLDPECWKSKCLSWCGSLIADNPGMVPIRQSYAYGKDAGLAEYFGLAPLQYWEWKQRDDGEAEREGYAAAVGVFVEGPDIGTTRAIWLPLPESDDGEESEVAEREAWRDNRITKHQMKSAFLQLIKTDIAAYLSELDTYATESADVVARNKLRACCWFGYEGFKYFCNEGARLDDPEWNPLAENAVDEIAGFLASINAEEVTLIRSVGAYDDTDKANAAILAAMFAIPLDVIITRAADELYKSTHEGGDANGSHKVLADKELDEQSTSSDFPENATDITADILIDKDDYIYLSENHPYHSAVSCAQASDERNKAV